MLLTMGQDTVAIVTCLCSLIRSKHGDWFRIVNNWDNVYKHSNSTVSIYSPDTLLICCLIGSCDQK